MKYSPRQGGLEGHIQDRVAVRRVDLLEHVRTQEAVARERHLVAGPQQHVVGLATRAVVELQADSVPVRRGGDGVSSGPDGISWVRGRNQELAAGRIDRVASQSWSGRGNDVKR